MCLAIFIKTHTFGNTIRIISLVFFQHRKEDTVMFIKNILKLSLKNSILLDTTHGDVEELCTNAMNYLASNKYMFFVDNNTEDELSNATFIVFNICLPECVNFATLVGQSMFMYKNMSNSDDWVYYIATEKSQKKVQSFSMSMSIKQYNKYVYDQCYAMTFNKEEIPVEETDFYRNAMIGKKIMQLEIEIKKWCIDHNVDEKEITGEIEWSLKKDNVASSRYTSRCKLWKKLFNQIEI